MAKKTTENKSKEKKSEKKVSSSQSKILKNLARRLSDDYHPSENYISQKNGENKDPQIQKINRIIQKSSQEISGEADKKAEKKEDLKHKPSFNPSTFDGISDPKEERTLFIEKTKHLERENAKLKHELELLHEDFQKERADLKKTVRDLRGEMHRTAPITDNKLFHFSRELRHIAGTVQELSNENSINQTKSIDKDSNIDNLDTINSNPIAKASLSEPPDQRKVEKPKQVINQEVDKNKSKTKKEIKKNSKKKKTVIASTAVATALLVVISGALLTRQPKIDQDMVDSYLNQDGEVQGLSDDNQGQTPSLTKKEQKDNQASFDETIWETYRDEFLGFQVKYPDNVTDTLHTGNTMTFLRKDGYLFKIQRIYTDKSLEDYWEATKNDGLEYESESMTLEFSEALHLTLIEEVDFPGNRYLVKSKEHIFDVWYATPSNHFDDDDMKRVDYMINSLRFL